MKRSFTIPAILVAALLLVLASCQTPVSLVSWKNPASSAKISKVAIMPLFERIDYLKAFEQGMTAFFTKKGLSSVGSLDFLNPNVKYPIDDIKHRCDSLGVDAILLFIYKGTDKSDSYIPPTSYYTGTYGGYGGYWGGGWWGGYGDVVTTGGYWTTTHVINLSAKLFVKGSPDPVWTGDVSITDPDYVDTAAKRIGQQIFSDWKQNNLLE